MSDPSYRIGTLARLTGVSTHALRIWERRYGALTPTRTPKGARLYSASDFERVRLLKQLSDRDHAIGTIASLPIKQLRELARRADPAPEIGAEAGADARELSEALVAAAANFDVERAARILRQVSARFSTRDTVLSVIGPVLENVGRRWQVGELCIASEHAMSAILRTHLGQLLTSGPLDGEGTIVCATPAGELHELGALIVSVLAAVHGMRPLFLGPNLPADEIAQAARMSQAEIVALSIVSLEPARAEAEIVALARLLPRKVELLLGGKGARKLDKLPKRVSTITSLAELDGWLEARSGAPRRASRG